MPLARHGAGDAQHDRARPAAAPAERRVGRRTPPPRRAEAGGVHARRQQHHPTGRGGAQRPADRPSHDGGVDRQHVDRPRRSPAAPPGCRAAGPTTPRGRARSRPPAGPRPPQGRGHERQRRRRREPHGVGPVARGRSRARGRRQAGARAAAAGRGRGRPGRAAWRRAAPAPSWAQACTTTRGRVEPGDEGLDVGLDAARARREVVGDDEDAAGCRHRAASEAT